MGNETDERLWVCDACNEEWASVEPAPCSKCGVDGVPIPSKACPTCGVAIREAARVCRHCDAHLATRPCPSCGAQISEDSPSCTVCGWSPKEKPAGKEMRKRERATARRREKEWDAERDSRPIRVTLLALLYLLLGTGIALPTILSTAHGVQQGDANVGLFGLILFVPSGLLLVTGIAFFVRAPWAPGLAFLLGLGALVIGTILVLAQQGGRAPWEMPFTNFLYMIYSAAVSVLVGLLHLVLVSSDATQRWFRGERPPSDA